VAHPVRLVVQDDLRRTRVTVALRLLLVLPHLVVLGAWAGGVAALLPFRWLSLLARAQDLRPAGAASARFAAYASAVGAYGLLLADPWPSLRARPRPIELDLPEATRQRRATVLLRPLLALPAVVFASVLAVVSLSAAVVAWFPCAASARMPAGLQELGVYCLRFHAQTLAFVLLLTERYPSLAGTAEGGLVTAPSESRR